MRHRAGRAHAFPKNSVRYRLTKELKSAFLPDQMVFVYLQSLLKGYIHVEMCTYCRDVLFFSFFLT